MSEPLRERLYLGFAVLGFIVPLTLFGVYFADNGFDIGQMFDDAVDNTVALAILCDITIACLVFWSWAVGGGPAARDPALVADLPGDAAHRPLLRVPALHVLARAGAARRRRTGRRLALGEQVPVVAAVEEERVALARLGLDRVAGEDHVVAALDHVAQLAGDPDQGVVEAGGAAALGVGDALPLLGLVALAGEAAREVLLARRRAR